MKKATVLFLTSCLLTLAACTSIDCPLDHLVMTKYALKQPGLTTDTLKDTLNITTRQMDGKDTLLLNKGGFSLNLSWILVLGACLYVVSFLTSMVVMKGMNLSVFYPLSAGLIYIAVCILSFLLLKEKITTTQLIGMAVILAGIVIMNLNKNS